MAVHGQAVSDVLFEYYKEFQQYGMFGDVLLGLRQRKVIEDDEFKEYIQKSRKEQVLFLVDKIPTGGDNAFRALLESISEKDETFAKKLLESMEKKDPAFARTLRNGMDKLIPHNIRHQES